MNVRSEGEARIVDVFDSLRILVRQGKPVRGGELTLNVLQILAGQVPAGLDLEIRDLDAGGEQANTNDEDETRTNTTSSERRHASSL